MPDKKPIPNEFFPAKAFRREDLNHLRDSSISEFTGGDGIDVTKIGSRRIVSQQPPTSPDSTAHVTFVVIQVMPDYLVCQPMTYKQQDPKQNYSANPDAQNMIQPGMNFQLDPTKFNSSLGSSLPQKQYVYVAKPWTLQKTPWDGSVVNGITYDYSVDWGGRIASGLDETMTPQVEAQVIVPAYFQGDIIVARLGQTNIVLPGTEDQEPPQGPGNPQDPNNPLNKQNQNDEEMPPPPPYPQTITLIDINEAGRAWAMDPLRVP